MYRSLPFDLIASLVLCIPAYSQQIKPPLISKTFGVPTIAPGGSTTLSFSVGNPVANVTLTGINFTDPLPAGLVVAAPNGITGSCGGGTIVATAGSGTIRLIGATLTSNTACNCSVNVTATTAGTFVNVTENILSDQSDAGLTATATLVSQTPVLPPAISKSFPVLTLPAGANTTLTFVIANPNAATALTGVAFTDTIPAPLVISTPNALTSNCGGSLTAPAGTNLVTLTGATLAGGASCAIGVNVTGVAQGAAVNTTSTVTSANGGTGNFATATLVVGDTFLVSYAANLNLSDGIINLSNAGTQNTAAGAASNLCAHVYTFSPDEQLVACCSCLVTPDGLASLSARNDLITNTLSPFVPTAVVVKLVTTVPPAAGICNGANVTTANLAVGLLAWQTRLHAAPAPAGAYVVTETKFGQAALSPAELARISGLCGYIQAVGSGFGICRSCRLGGQGAAVQQ